MRRQTFFLCIFSVLFIAISGSFLIPGNEAPRPYDFKYPPEFGKPNLPASNPMTVEGVWLGRLLFYDSLMSINGKMSCGTCHQQKLSFTDGLALAVGVHGDTLKRNTMSLINLAWGQRFFWDGRVTTLEDLVKEPLIAQKEMGGLTETELLRRLRNHPYYPALFKKAFPGEDITMATVSKAIAQFLRTIVSRVHVTPKDDPKDNGRILDPIRDSVLMKENSLQGSIERVSLMQCKSCHQTEGFGGQIVTVNEHDSLFKPVSFMNWKYTGPYFHDGRFKTLKEVFQFYNDNIETLQIKNPKLMVHQKVVVKFTQYDLDHAEELFAVFTDSTINTNPAFSDPFGQKGFTWYGMNNMSEKKNP